MKKILATILAVAMLATTFVGCGGAPTGEGAGSKNPDASTDGGQPVEAADINACIGPEPETLDPALNKSVDGACYAIHAFEGIYKFNSENEAVTGQAEKVEVSEDGLTWDITLRDDIKWSDGKDVTVDDFIFSWQRAASPETASDYANLFDVIEGGADVYQGKADPSTLGVTKVDDKKMQIKLAAPCPYFDKLLAFPVYYPVRKDVVEGNDGWTQDAATFIGNGPMMLKEWKHKESITYVKNPHYYDADKVTNSAINFILLEDDNAKMAAYDNGELDYVFQLPIDEIDALKQRPEFGTINEIGTYYLAFQTEKKPFDDPRVRKALSLAIDRNYIVETVSKQGEIPATAIVAAKVSENDKSFRENGGDYYSVKPEDYEKNIAEAKQLLADAGYPDGQGFPTFEYTTNTATLHLGIAEALQNMWKENLGIECKIAQQEWNVFLATRPAGTFEVARDGWIADYDDPLTFLEIFKSDNGNNDCHWKNADFDKLIDQAKAEPDAEKRFALLHEAENVWAENMPGAPIFYYADTFLKRDTLNGYWDSPLGYKFFMYCTKA